MTRKRYTIKTLAIILTPVDVCHSIEPRQYWDALGQMEYTYQSGEKFQQIIKIRRLLRTLKGSFTQTGRKEI
jgi:hypothetical protein